jgi:hypothetical protein
MIVDVVWDHTDSIFNPKRAIFIDWEQSGGEKLLPLSEACELRGKLNAALDKILAPPPEET